MLSLVVGVVPALEEKFSHIIPRFSELREKLKAGIKLTESEGKEFSLITLELAFFTATAFDFGELKPADHKYSRMCPGKQSIH
ncbi:hypothetical protein MJO52_11895 [Microbulbifer variabilis]|uniref:Uncharacterized protein n=1 Tax=Microbulbifer variabilis TaxID=266805 RepID=A0ABY4VA78_9GAMM|nr:hypothetical protein [Microbulbifer variabilis]USD19785.1 hypothetical protein MJO52_11895 [Microbulbifer variabilis]